MNLDTVKAFHKLAKKLDEIQHQSELAWKPGELTHEEMELMSTHTPYEVLGYALEKIEALKTDKQLLFDQLQGFPEKLMRLRIILQTKGLIKRKIASDLHENSVA